MKENKLNNIKEKSHLASTSISKMDDFKVIQFELKDVLNKIVSIAPMSTEKIRKLLKKTAN